MKPSKDVQTIVLDEIKSILERKSPQAPPVILKSNLFNGETGLDSLDLAELIINLEGIFGMDPFGGKEAVKTVEELIAFYQQAARKS